MTKRNAWKVEPNLVDRFLKVLAENGFKWASGHKANKYKNWNNEELMFFIEVEPKTIVYLRNSVYPNEPFEELNVTEVTEELLKEMESEGVSSTIVSDDPANPLCARYNSGIISIDEFASNTIESHDPVNHPSHYNHGGVETIEIIRMILSEEEYRGFLKGNILKYRERAPYKGNAEEDYAKARWYLDEMMS